MYSSSSRLFGREALTSVEKCRRIEGTRGGQCRRAAAVRFVRGCLSICPGGSGKSHMGRGCRSVYRSGMGRSFFRTPYNQSRWQILPAKEQGSALLRVCHADGNIRVVLDVYAERTPVEGDY